MSTFKIYNHEHLTWSELVDKMTMEDKLDDLKLILESYTDGKIDDLIGGIVDVDLDTIREIAEFIKEMKDSDLVALQNAIGLKADTTYVDDQIRDAKDYTASIIDKEKVVVFITSGKVISGLQGSNLIIPFDCKLKSITVSMAERDNESIKVMIQKSDDYITWTNLINGEIELISNVHFSEYAPPSDIPISKSQMLRLNVTTLSEENKNLNVNLIVEKQ